MIYRYDVEPNITFALNSSPTTLTGIIHGTFAKYLVKT